MLEKFFNIIDIAETVAMRIKTDFC